MDKSLGLPLSIFLVSLAVAMMIIAFGISSLQSLLHDSCAGEGHASAH
jgi:hypothetical protein